MLMDEDVDCLDDLPPLHKIRILHLRAVHMEVVLHLLRRVRLEALAKLELVHYFDAPEDFDPFLKSESQDLVPYRSLITAAFTRPDIRCVKWDLLEPAEEISLWGS
ncbi:hypothetical protein FRB99_001389 [Tulasnella sp. 403]|nr:hypothetical protein FRB99_001389 [Tulasnella sp. 403]